MVAEAKDELNDWLSRREAKAYSCGMLAERVAGKAAKKAFSEIMDLLGCDSNTQYSKVPGMVRKLLKFAHCDGC